MGKESSLIKRLKGFGKTGLKIAAVSYAALVIAEAGLESYYIMRDKITSGQSYESLGYALSYNKNIPDITKTLFGGFILAHAINFISNFGEEEFL